MLKKEDSKIKLICSHKLNYFFVFSTFSVLAFFFIFIFLNLNFSFAQTAVSSDAIAVRVMPNPNHFSISNWYASQGFQGGLESLSVDGYDAVRSGRTVYVAATNIKDTDTNNRLSKSDVLYTNVYIISYNQEVKNATIDIFGQLLNNWKFNINITQAGRCRYNPSVICAYTDQCPTNDYCKSTKSVIIRDTKRLADLNDLNTALYNYKNNNGGLCPKLAAGSYLANKSISTWSSWQETLGKELGIALPVDPINKLGQCSSDQTENKKYDPITCWNAEARKFSGLVGSEFNLPSDSLAYSYVAASDGKSCSFKMTTESGLTCDNNGGCTVNNNLFDATNGYCGDISVQTDLGEECDDGNNNNSDACANNCRWTIKKMPAPLFSGGGVADALVYDDNDLSSSINNVSGIYLKLDKMLDTPYAWFADTNNNLITQVRTYVKCYSYGAEVHPDDKWNLNPTSQGKTGYVCPKKLPDGWDYSAAAHQHPGQIIKDFLVIGYPSRTAVNVETNEVWVAARSGAVWGGPGQVEKLQMDASGDYSSVANIPNSKFLGLVRGLTIQRDGDIWVADCTGNASTASLKRFSGATLNLNKTIGVDGNFVCPYGLAIDSEDNIWLNDMGGGGMKKVNPSTGQVYNYTNAGVYGITIDINDNVWGGGYSYGYGIKKIPYGQNSGAATHFTDFTNWQTYMTGVTLDKEGNIWGGGYTPQYKTYKFNQAGVLQPGFPVSSGGVNPHGIFGTSDGYVWQSHISSNIIRVFNPSGSVVADFKGGKIAGGIYTYSDATGLNRAMVMRSGLWVSDPIDGGFANQHWGNIFWQQSIPTDKQNLEVYARAADDTDNLKNKPWIRTYLVGDSNNIGSTWNALSATDNARVGRYVQFKVLLRSTEKGVTPVVWNLQIQ